MTLLPDIKGKLAIGHNEKLEPVRNWDDTTLAGAGSLFSSVDDLLVFLSAHINVDRSPLGGAMQSMLTIRRPTGITNIEIALGWHVSRRRDHEVAWHNGCTGGYSSFIAFSPVDRVGVVILANTAVDVDNLGFSIFDYLLPIAIK